MNSFRACSVLVFHEQTHIAATRLVWTVVLLNCRLVDHFQTVGHLKCTDKCVYKIFWRSKGGFKQTPSNPHAYGPDIISRSIWKVACLGTTVSGKLLLQAIVIAHLKH